jgi:GntR family transcriptional regulator
MRKFDTKSFELDVDVKSAIPIYEQIKNAIKMAIFSLQLKEEDKIISVRNLSTRHNINPLTILKAYNQLEREGFLYSRRGSGYYVKPIRGKSIEEKKKLLKKEVSAFYKKIISLGFTLNELQQELKNQLEVKK